jgi:hypothetical protein
LPLADLAAGLLLLRVPLPPPPLLLLLLPLLLLTLLLPRLLPWLRLRLRRLSRARWSPHRPRLRERLRGRRGRSSLRRPVCTARCDLLQCSAGERERRLGIQSR